MLRVILIPLHNLNSGLFRYLIGMLGMLVLLSFFVVMLMYCGKISSIYLHISLPGIYGFDEIKVYIHASPAINKNSLGFN